jgi:ribosome-binding factor A
MVRSVVPGPDSSRLLVTLVFQGSETVDRADILAALQDARARLRAEIATAIHRRKTPELSFNVIRE